MNNFVFSDPHFGHSNIINYCNRPFTTVKEMDEAILANINSVVGIEDTLWCLGDWGFGLNYYIEYTRQQIKCRDVRLVYGNHDFRSILRRKHLRDLFTTCAYYYECDFDSQKVLMTHWPEPEHLPANLVDYYITQKKGLHLHGHTHNNSDITWQNMSVENINYTPVNILDIIKEHGQI
jgi:calcineurin-like phosphoesterase family protein